MQDQSLTADERLILAKALPWFDVLSIDGQAWLIASLNKITVRGGETLFSVGGRSDSLYVVVSGSLGAYVDDSDKLIGQISVGETVGETGILTSSPRGATVRALRDSELVQLPQHIFDKLAQTDPQVVITIAQQALRRASIDASKTRHEHGPRTIAILPQCEGIDLEELAIRLKAAIKPFGAVECIDRKHGLGKPISWFHHLESKVRYVVYIAEAASDEWRELCQRQADCVMFVGLAHEQAAPWSELAGNKPARLPAAAHLVLMHGHQRSMGVGARWNALAPNAQLHHVKNDRDIARLARLMLGFSLGLVLSGGGARGFAHIGVIKALREANFEIDIVGGTSIGAVIGAGVAADWSTEKMIAKYRRAFVDTNPMSDYTLPLVSLVSGRKTSRLLRETFGERDIEDLRLPFFCISANLTKGVAVQHSHGKLWQALRASVSIPGILPPVFQDGQVLVDGGVIDNLPVAQMRERHLGEVISVDIGGDYAVRSEVNEFDLPPWWQLLREHMGARKRPRLVDILLRSGMLNATVANQQAHEASRLVIRPDLAGVGLMDWHAFERAIDIGYQHTIRLVGGQRDALTMYTPWLGI